MIESIPEFHLIKKDIECPWNAKGKVMREFIGIPAVSMLPGSGGTCMLLILRIFYTLRARLQVSDWYCKFGH